MNGKMENEFDHVAIDEIDRAQLESIATALRVHSGLQAGRGSEIQPCL